MMNNILKRSYLLLGILIIFMNMIGCNKDGGNLDMENVSYQAMTVEEFEQISPNAYDLDLAKEKGLAKKEIYDGDYLEVQAAYLSLLNYYLCREAKLDDYQDAMNDSDYLFPEGEESIYKKMGSFSRKNIYIRNNVYVERLSMESIHLLQENMKDGMLNVNHELIDMVEKTMSEVITVRYDDSNTEFEAIYEIGVFQTNMAPNNALVLAISYDFEYDENGNILSDEIEEKKEVFLNELKGKMESKMSKKLGVPVCVFY